MDADKIRQQYETGGYAILRDVIDPEPLAGAPSVWPGRRTATRSYARRLPESRPTDSGPP